MYRQYHDMVGLLVPESKGKFSIDCFEILPNNFQAAISGISSGQYVRLLRSGECVMSNTDMEKRTNREFLHRAHGDVLIGGLGIGMVILPIQNDPAVKSITVIEKYQDCIDLITSQIKFNEKVNIICADVFNWKPSNGERFDVIYMDIWDYINEDIYEEMKKLTRRYSKWLKSLEESPLRWNDCWCKYQAKHNMRI